VPEWVEDNDDIATMTDARAIELMYALGSEQSSDFTINPMKGTPGEYYRERRAEDIEELCRELIAEKRAAEHPVAAGVT
jgi:hypothetical protein